LFNFSFSFPFSFLVSGNFVLVLLWFGFYNGSVMFISLILLVCWMC
jgi:hypothetical protein